MSRRYWDSCCFLAWLRADSDETQAAKCKMVIDEAKAGKIQLVTSALTLAEVLWMKSKPPIPESDAQKVQDFFLHEWIIVRELDRKLAEDARRLVWSNSVKPKDAIHVATALSIHIDTPLDQLDSFDGGVVGLSEKLGSPPLKCGHPGIPGKPEKLF